jgi:hypothetical protein
LAIEYRPTVLEADSDGDYREDWSENHDSDRRNDDVLEPFYRHAPGRRRCRSQRL